MTTRTLAAAALLLACLCGSALAQQRETIRFDSQWKGKPVQITGTLHWPSQTGVVPAMVIHHGSGGINHGREGRYASELTAMGVAALVIDSFGPRGISSTVTDQTQVGSQDYNLDAIGALKALAANPRIARDRIGIVGFSKGGLSALMVSHERVLTAAGVPPGLRYALHVPFYPGCIFHYHQPRTSGAPIYMLLGGADSYTGTEPCATYANTLRAAGARIEVKIYAGAGHGFDGGPPFSNPQGQNFSQCVSVEQADGSYVDRKSGVVVGKSGPDGWLVNGPRAVEVFKSCMTSGVSGGEQAAAKAQSMEDFKSYVRRHLLSR